VAILEELLEDYQLETAAHGIEALEKLDRFQPDLILLDVMMPKMDGFEVCRRIRQSEGFMLAKIIFVSGKALLEERLAGYEAGGDDYIVKPFEHEEVLAKVKTYLRLKRIEEIDRIKGDLLSLISHETRTPLTTILAMAEFIIQDPSLGRPEIEEYARKIRDCGLKLADFAAKTDLLCKLKGLTGVSTQPLPIGELVDFALHGSRPAATVKRLEVEKHIAAGMVSGDADLLTKAMDFVFENAVKFSPPGGVIRIDGAPHGDGRNYVLSILDHGKGIPPALHEKVFQEFSVREISHHSEGQGLSLAIARRILILHGGRLEVASEEGKGAAFTFRLPAAGA
jgi:signal transduction histidine kinase